MNNIEIISGDCAVKMKEFAADSVHLILTDPPYFIDSMDDEWTASSRIKKSSSGVIKNLASGMKFDPAQGLKLESFIGAIAREWNRILKPGGFALVFSQPRLSHRMAVGIENAGFEIRDMYAWRYTKQSQIKAFSQEHFVRRRDIPEVEKERIIKSLAGRKTAQLKPNFETIIMAQKPKIGTHVDNWMAHEVGLIEATESLDGNAPSTVMTVEKPSKEEKKDNDHPTVKPVALLCHLIKLFSKEGQTVMDSFMGSGSAAIAAMKTKRNFIGIEKNDAYVKIAENKISKERDSK